MKTILCYGDSNTWGYNPVDANRFPMHQRWAGVLQQALGAQFKVIEEGLNGRTTVWDDPVEGLHKNGRTYLLPCLESHAPLDLFIIMLGTNDLKKRFSVSARDIADSIGTLVQIVQGSGAGHAGQAPKILVLAPPPLANLTEFAEMFEDAEPKARVFGEYYRQIAEQHDCAFLNTSDVISSSDLDGIHLEQNEHTKLGKAVAQMVQQFLG